jgi:hypothetical protein
VGCEEVGKVVGPDVEGLKVGDTVVALTTWGEERGLAVGERVGIELVHRGEVSRSKKLLCCSCCGRAGVGCRQDESRGEERRGPEGPEKILLLG